MDANTGNGANGFLTWYQFWFPELEPALHFRLDGPDIRLDEPDIPLIKFLLRETRKLELEMSGPQVVSDCTNSAETFKLVHKWVWDCVERHNHCNHGVERSWRPTRLLELDRPSVGYISLNWPRELTTTEFDSYATLSHCWGNGVPLKLTLSTQSALLEGVLISTLPQTFRDAIVVTRTLGLKFIWIDSLCIFQDSPDDWVRESSLMGKVYSQALCNIGATASAAGNEGCFRHRSPLLLDRTVIESSWTDLPNARFHVFANADQQHRGTHSPLLRRGWVVQEHVLSRRFLHFDAKQVLFECRQGYVSEMYPEGTPIEILPLTYPLQKAAEPHDLIYHEAESVDVRDLYNFWARVVGFYSMCSLKIDTDILVAISGIAKRLQGNLYDAYYAGIWKGQLPQCLLWRAKHGVVDKVTQPSSYLAPTWSWASVKIAVDFPRMDSVEAYSYTKILAEVVQTEIVLASPDPTGQVLSGFIKLRGMLWTVVLHWRNETNPFIWVKPMVVGNIGGHEPFAFEKVYIDNPIARGSIAAGAKLHFMPISRVSYSEDYKFFAGLLLCPTDECGQFQRVRVLELNWSPETAVEIERIFSAENNDWLEYEEFEGDKYTITIV
ncbi:hypothetical protein G7Y89_g7720 [Cudoniella acicularis]|uniref:Heterokaryon incompatibility domain-containing protein n=1 Tax=Cudoniella acicularis TaxID=354080 RepID=A0A8H4RJJ5_9HELO|nr:hypothetical protein G7Y89_g7720 [Cudoniella acicularis]